MEIFNASWNFNSLNLVKISFWQNGISLYNDIAKMTFNHHGAEKINKIVNFNMLQGKNKLWGP